MDVSTGGWSIGELSTLAAKAVRGAGLPWGIAEEAGHIVRTLCGWNLAAVEPLVADLACDNPGQSLHLACSISDGMALEDLAKETAEIVPLLIAPALSSRLVRSETLTLHAAAGVAGLHVWNGGAEFPKEAGLSMHGPFSFATSVRSISPTSPTHSNRVSDVDPVAYDRLAQLAHRTYAPASARSRATGAGAGLLDND
ncbi:MAG: DUF3726 domain-containing protein [Pseudomonadota bacterium]